MVVHRSNRRPEGVDPPAGVGSRQAGQRRQYLFKGIGLFVALAASGVLLGCARQPPSGHALIIDQLSLTFPSPSFVEEASATLVAAGYSVEYIAGRDVTVDLFRELPSHDAQVVILRVHAARMELPGGVRSNDVALFTGEMIDVERYRLAGIPAPAMTAVAEVLAGQSHSARAVSDLNSFDIQHVSPVFYDPKDQELPHFGVNPSFFAEVTVGSFPNSTVFLMGCDSLRSPATASAFASHNAKHIVGWDDTVTVEHTDRSILRLLALIYGEGMPHSAAVDQTMIELGADPIYGARLIVYDP